MRSAETGARQAFVEEQVEEPAGARIVLAREQIVAKSGGLAETPQGFGTPVAIDPVRAGHDLQSRRDLLGRDADELPGIGTQGIARNAGERAARDHGEARDRETVRPAVSARR